MTAYLLAIDQGTSSSRAIVFNDRGEIEVVFQKELSILYPQAGWVEQKPSEILSTIEEVLRSCAQYCAEKGIKITAAGITNQRETTILWDRKTGEPFYNAIVWQDRRTTDLCAELQGKGMEDLVRERTGLRLDPYFSATKIRWILDNIDGVRARALGGDVCFGTVDSFLIWHLSDQKNHVTDATNASRTMAYNIIGQKWDDKIIQNIDIHHINYPKTENNISNFGQINDRIFGYKIPIFGVAGDQQAALIGQGCITSGMMKVTYGTGCFALMHIGDTFRPSQNGLLTTIASRIDGRVSYAIEGSIFNAGTAIQFLRDNLGIIHKASETQAMAESIPDNGGVYFVPALTGLGAPYWRPDARGVIAGLDRNTTKAHIVRAALEAQAYQTRDLIAAMEQDAGQNITTIRADGGLVANDFMDQFLADITQRVIEVPHITEATAWGAACLAGVGAGVFKNLEETAKLWRAEKVFTPQRSLAEADALYAGWKAAVARVLV